jgi:alcohol dehydrogenase YqhD (iron-dependent ADH family)
VDKAVPIGAIVTLPATASENNSGAVITNEDGNLKYFFSDEKLYPKFAISNPELTYTLPAYQTAAGAVDTISHVMGSYITSQWDNELIHSMIEALIKTVIKYTPIAIKEPENYEARAQLMWAAAIACNGPLNIGCVGDFTSHVIQHEFGALYDITHGAGLAIVLLGHSKYIVDAAPARFARFADHVFGVEYDYANPMATALEGIDRMEKLFERLGMPTRFSQAGIDDSRFEEIAKRIKSFQGIYGDIKKLDVQDTINILNLCK